VLPLKDDNPTRRLPVLTIALIVVNTVVYVTQWVRPEDGNVEDSEQAFACRWGLIPDALFHGRDTGLQDLCTQLNTDQDRFLTVFTSQFLHGSWLHLAGNMLFLWVFGNNIEDRLGRVRFLPFYLVCGAIAGVVQSVIDTGSDVPLIGASGAIAGVLGAYIVLYPHARVWTLVMFIPLRIPAWMVLGLWFVFQFLYAGGQAEGGGGVAWVAHLGGFVAGMLLIKPFLVGRPEPPPRRPPPPTVPAGGWG
jgi:membrane associated rhomboid family serine protease